MASAPQGSFARDPCVHACAANHEHAQAPRGSERVGGRGSMHSTVHSAQHAPTHARSMLAPPTVALPTNAASAHGLTAHACSAHACSAHACSAHASTHACSTHACSVVARSVVARLARPRSVPTNAPVIAKTTRAKGWHDGDGDGHDGGGRDGGGLDGGGREGGRGGVPGHSDLRSAAQEARSSVSQRVKDCAAACTGSHFMNERAGAREYLLGSVTGPCCSCHCHERSQMELRLIISTRS